MTAAVFLQGSETGVHSDDVIQGNKLSGGAYTVYAGAPLARNVDFLDNVFVRDSVYTKGGVFGSVGYYSAGNGNDWSGNTWSDTGAVVSP